MADTPHLLPAPHRPHWVFTKWFIELLTAAPAVLAVIYAAIHGWKGFTRTTGALIFAAFWAGGTSFLKIRLAASEDADDEEKKSPDAVEGSLHCIHALICHLYDIDDKNKDSVRIVMHRYVPKNEKTGKDEHFEQITRYVGGPGGSVNRTSPVNCGLVGQVIRSGEAKFSQRTSGDSGVYVKELMEAFSYSRSQAKELKDDRWSLFAVPLFEEKNKESVIGVVFMDSSQKNLFGDKEGTGIIAAACEGLNQFVNKRYMPNAK